jgi:predicted TPR repeat methyltransferase
MPVRLFLSSGDLMADRRFDFARDLQLKGDLVAAADLLLQAAELAPGFASAWFTLADIRERLGQREAAIAAFRKAQVADPDDRHGAGLRLMLLGAEPLSAMPPAYVRALFDQYAPKFEAALVDDLGYRGPDGRHQPLGFAGRREPGSAYPADVHSFYSPHCAAHVLRVLRTPSD